MPPFVNGSDAIRLSVVIVTHNSSAAVTAALPALASQLGAGDELIVVDNASTDDTVAVVGALAPQAIVVDSPHNSGFAGGANAGARRASGDLLLFLNPDATPADGFAQAIRRPLLDASGWAAWMGLVTAERGRVINTSGGVVHFTGIAWAGEAGRPVAGAAENAREVAFVTGACLAVPRVTWDRVGGFAEDFFMYHEDVDISLRLRLAGGRLGIEPSAVVDHDYEFLKAAAKWRYLERNRWATILRTYPTLLLVLLAPALLATEIALLAASTKAGWATQKLRATTETLRSLKSLLRQRREIQAGRRISSSDFARWLSPDLDSAYLGRAATSPVLRRLLRGYWAVVLAVLRLETQRR